MNAKRVALWFLIVSVAISAVLGIIAILTGKFGDLQIRIILTTLTISGASICALACGALREKQKDNWLAPLGIILAGLFAVLVIIGIWAEIDATPYWKLSSSTIVAAFAAAHVCLLSLARLAARFTWARVAAFAAIFTLAVLIILSIYIEPTGDLGFRMIGSVAVVVAAFTIMIPIFHRLSREDLTVQPAHESGRQQLWATISCPQCGAGHPNTSAETTCDRCGCRFVVKIIEPGRNA